MNITQVANYYKIDENILLNLLKEYTNSNFDPTATFQELNDKY
jgi:hypothetical protein